MEALSSAPVTYFVRVNGRIMGPFPLTVLASMCDRGRISTDSDVSTDRRNWFPLARLGSPATGVAEVPREDGPLPAGPGGLIVPGPADVSVLAPPPLPAGLATPALTMPSGTQCFYSVDGSVVGPIEFSALIVLARDGRLTARDRVWLAGQADWHEAGQVPGLAFRTQRSKVGAWISNNPALATCAALAFLVLVVGPTALVLGRAYLFESEQQRVAAAAKERHENAVQQERERIERLREDERESLARADRLELRKAEMQNQYELIMQQYTNLRVAKVNADREEARAAETQRQIDAARDEIAQARSEAAGFAAERKASEEELARLTAQGNASLERIVDEEKKQTELIDRATP